jgi:capsid protein
MTNRLQNPPILAASFVGREPINGHRPGTTALGYDGATADGRRRAAPSRLRSEDDELTRTDRRNLTNAGRDLLRNFEIAGWAIRKHLDFVASFHFEATTPDPVFNTEYEAAVEEWGQKRNADSDGRHPRRRMLRMAEARRALDGDIFWLKRRNGTIQAIEGDRVRQPASGTKGLPDGVQTTDLANGLWINKLGRVIGYAVHSRTKGGGSDGFKFERIVPAAQCLHHAYYGTERIDQTRGISPMAAAVNRYQDVYEGFTYALAKAKLSQLFGMKITRDAVDGPDPENTAAGYDVQLGKGPFMLDMDPGDDAAFLESSTPSTQFQEFSRLMISVALKSLDIPYNFFDEKYVNFSGAKGSLILYLESCRTKRQDNIDLLSDVTRWRTAKAILAGDLTPPRTMAPKDVTGTWTPTGIPWWNPSQEIKADLEAIKGGLRTRTEIRKERFGDDWRTAVVDVLKTEEDYLNEQDIQGVAVGPPPAPMPGAANP